MNKSKIIVIMLCGIGLMTIGSGIFMFKNASSTDNPPSEIPEKSPLGDSSGMSPEEFYNWETNLNIRAAEIVDETFGGNYTLDENGEFNIKLSDLNKIYNKDLSEFNTDTITCDLEKSTIQVYKEDGSYEKAVSLFCTNSAE